MQYLKDKGTTLIIIGQDYGIARSADLVMSLEDGTSHVAQLENLINSSKFINRLHNLSL